MYHIMVGHTSHLLAHFHHWIINYQVSSIAKSKHTHIAHPSTPDIFLININSIQSNDISTNSETMTADNITKIEDGVIDEPRKTTRPTPTTGLSLVSRMYDFDGDGALDEAELASKVT